MKYNISLFCIKAFCIYKKVIIVIGIYLKSHVHVCFVYLLTVMEKRFYHNFTALLLKKSIIINVLWMKK